MESKKNALLFATILVIISSVATALFFFGDKVSINKIKNIFTKEQKVSEIATTTPTTKTTEEDTKTVEKNVSTTTAKKKSWFSFLDLFKIDPNNLSGPLVTIPDDTVKKENLGPNAERTTEEISVDIQKTSYEVEKIQNEIARMEEEKNASPLKGKIVLEQTYSTYGTDPDQEYLTIRSAYNLPDNEKVLITGLKLYSTSTGQTVTIPDGVYLPQMNQKNIEQPIFLGKNESAKIITGYSPFGYSFKTNICSGYWKQSQTFKINLPYTQCPYLRDEPQPKWPNQLNDNCLDYIQSFPSCTSVTDKSYNTNVSYEYQDPFLKLSPDCQSFIREKTGYNNCIYYHKNDKNFYTNEWYIYLNRTQRIWKTKRETIQLLDKDGKIISQIKY